MKSPNLFILTFILFITDLNHSVRCEKQTTPTQEDVRASSNVSNQTRKYLSGSPSNQTRMYSSGSSSNPDNDSPNLPDQGLEVVSVTKELNRNTTITSDEHLSNESSVTKEITKNLMSQKLNKVSNDKVSNDKASNDKASNDKLSNDKVSNDKVSNDKVSNDKVSNDKVSNDKVSNDKLANDKQQTPKKKLQSVPSNSTVKLTNSTVKLTNSTIKKVDECSKAQIDYLILSLTWPVNICSKRACILNSPQRWFIHNLSPVFHIQDSSQISKCCSKRPFNASEIGSLITTELKEHMQSVLATKPDETFWLEEWNNFGTCLRSIEKLNTVYKYFSEMVRLFKEVNLEEWLKAHNIVPLDDINKVYEFKAFYEAINSKRSFKFQVKCSPLINNQTKSIIDHVNFCYDKQLKKINCPSISLMESNCNRQIVFPTLDTDITEGKRKRSGLNSREASIFNRKSALFNPNNHVNFKSANQSHSLASTKQSGWISVTTKENWIN